MWGNLVKFVFYHSTIWFAIPRHTRYTKMKIICMSEIYAELVKRNLSYLEFCWGIVKEFVEDIMLCYLWKFWKVGVGFCRKSCLICCSSIWLTSLCVAFWEWRLAVTFAKTHAWLTAKMLGVQVVIGGIWKIIAEKINPASPQKDSIELLLLLERGRGELG